MATTFTCERDGIVLRGETEDDLVANVEQHVVTLHPDLVGKLLRADVLAAATYG
jgi:hypothetical protein